ncbi:MAG: trypsin-like serine protease [Gemmatimonadaceae bacterium]|nr:trypsin-like serine protease [Gemmatimonadaceae bacterium]
MKTVQLARMSVLAAAVAVSAAPLQVGAQRVASGVSNGIAWQAESRIVGTTSTGPVNPPGTGNPIYVASQPAYSGVVSLIMTQANGSRFICSGTLLPDRISILTAGHCVSSGFGTANPVSTMVYFPGSNADAVVHITAGIASRSVTQYIVHPNYTGEVIDQNDIAILRLNAPAPLTASSYGLFTPPSLAGTDFNVAGYGGRSDVGGSFGVNLGVGVLRQGDNRYDFRFGDRDFNGFWTDRNPGTGRNFFGLANIDFSYVSDFDSGLAVNDASCRIAAAINATLTNAKYCNLGRGAREASVAGGDSGGPQFVGGMISSVTSYGLSFGAGFGDSRPGIQSSFGEFNGFVPVYIHAAFITRALVPEPATYVLFGTGLFVIGFMARRRRLS